MSRFNLGTLQTSDIDAVRSRLHKEIMELTQTIINDEFELSVDSVLFHKDTHSYSFARLIQETINEGLHDFARDNVRDTETNDGEL